MNIYAIRKKGTDLYIPYDKKRKGGGNSSDEPTNEKPIRFMHTKATANRVLYAWLQGAWKNVYSSGGYGEPDEPYPEPKKLEHRKKEDMEIVEFKLIEKKCH